MYLTLRRAASTVVLAAAVTGVVVTTPAAVARPAARPAGHSVSHSAAAFGIQAMTDGRPDSRHSLSYSATPGATLEDQVAIVNLGRRPLRLDVYATDAASGDDGAFSLLPRAANPTDLGSWITLDRTGQVRVPARTGSRPARVVIHFRLGVPADATPGDHAAGIVVSLEGRVVNPQGLDVPLDQRVALRLYTRVSGPVRPGLSVDNLTMNYSGPALVGNPFGGGVATLHYQVHNTGNVLLGAAQQASVSSWLGGTAHATGLQNIPPLLPGATVAVTARVPDVFPGFRLTGAVRLEPVAPPGAADPKLDAVSASVGMWAIPWILIGLIVLLLFAGAGFFAWRLRARRRPPPANTSHRRSAVMARSGAGG